MTVTALRPGPTDTEFFERAGMQDTKVAAKDKDDPADVARQGFEALMAGKDRVVRRHEQGAGGGRPCAARQGQGGHARRPDQAGRRRQLLTGLAQQRPR